MLFHNIVRLPREIKGNPSGHYEWTHEGKVFVPDEACHHGRSLTREACPACGVEAGETLMMASREVYGIRARSYAGLPSVTIRLNGKMVASRLEMVVAEAITDLRPRLLLTRGRVVAEIFTGAEPNAATLATWIVEAIS